MTDFAKIFHYPVLGQVLVQTANGDKGPELLVTFRYHGTMCTTGITFVDSEEGELLQQKAFSNCSEEVVAEYVLKIVSKLDQTLEEE